MQNHRQNWWQSTDISRDPEVNSAPNSNIRYLFKWINSSLLAQKLFFSIIKHFCRTAAYVSFIIFPHNIKCKTMKPWLNCVCRGNVPGGAVQSGEELCHYLPPFPAKGTGFHRYVYVLFKQEGPIDFQRDARPSPWWAVVKHCLLGEHLQAQQWCTKHDG